MKFYNFFERQLRNYKISKKMMVWILKCYLSRSVTRSTWVANPMTPSERACIHEIGKMCFICVIRGYSLKDLRGSHIMAPCRFTEKKKPVADRVKSTPWVHNHLWVIIMITKSIASSGSRTHASPCRFWMKNVILFHFFLTVFVLLIKNGMNK